MTKKPTQHQLETAMEWLLCNEGAGPEQQACHATVKWLQHELDQGCLRDAAKKGGVPVAALRRKLDEQKERGQ